VVPIGLRSCGFRMHPHRAYGILWLGCSARRQRRPVGLDCTEVHCRTRHGSLAWIEFGQSNYLVRKVLVFGRQATAA